MNIVKRQGVCERESERWTVYKAEDRLLSEMTKGGRGVVESFERRTVFVPVAAT